MERKSNLSLKKGDTVVVIAGGSNKRIQKGRVGKILRFVGEERVVVEGVNMITRHQRARGPNNPAGKITKEGSIHLSNVMYYVEKTKKGVRLKAKVLADGKKVRVYRDPQSKQLVQLDN